MESYLFDMSGELLRIDGPDSTTWTLHDALGSARKLLNADGTLVDDKVGYNYDAFGSIITPYDGQGEAYDIAIEPQILFAGQLYEPISGMYFMGVRAYDPQLGRFIQRDPVRHDPQGTLYTYAYNRPGVYIDPNGMSPMSPHREAGAIRFPQDTYPASDPPSLTEEIPFIPTVAELQADENHRVLEASYEARFMINDFVAAVDPALCDFYLRGLNPIPDDVRDIMGQPLQEINNLYTSETGWQLTSTPDPTRNIDIFAIIDTVTPLLRQAQNGVNSVQMTGCNDYWILPQPSTPEELINSSQKQESFAQTLNEVSMVQTIPYQFELLTSLPDSIMPNPLSTILLQDVPQRDVGNELPKELRNLQTQTAEFYLSTIFLSGMGAENATYTNNHVEDILPPMPQSTDSRDH